MKLLKLVLFCCLLSLSQLLFAQNYVDISFRLINGGIEDPCPPLNGFSGDMLIHPKSGFNGIGIGWGANLYLASEIGGSNIINDLTWIIARDMAYAGNVYTFDNLDIWMYETTNSQFPDANRSAVETWTSSVSTPTYVSNVVKVISNGTLKFEIPKTVNECITSTAIFDTPYNYTGNNSLVIYIEKKTANSNPSGYVSFKHNSREFSSIKRRLCNWEGTIASPLPSTANNSSTNKFARVVFNRVFSNTLVNASCSSTNKISPCLSSAICSTAGTNTTVTICGPTTYSLVNSVISNTTATWTPSAGSPSLTGGYQGIFTTNNSGTYNYTYTIPANGSCPTSSAVVTVSVLPKPAGTGTNVSICAGSTYSLFPLLNAGSTSGTWSPTVGLSGGYMGVITPTASGSYTYKVSNSACNTFTSAVVTVSVPPNPAGTNATYTLCSAASTPTLYNVLNAKDPSGTWTPPNPSLSSGYLGVFSHSVEGVYTYTYTVLTPSVCPLMSSSSAIATVSVFPKPSAILTATNPACGKTNGVIFISDNSLNQTVTYTASAGVVAGQTVTVLGPGTVTVTLTNNFGCKFTAVETLTNSSGPTDFSLTPTHATCTNDNGELAFSSPVGGTAPYRYSVNGIAKSSPNSLLSAGIYTVKLEDASGCTFTKTTTLFNRKPTAITGTASSASCASPDGSYTITSVTDNGLSVSNYSFTMDGGTATTNTVFTNLASGIHTLSVINSSATACPYTAAININRNNTLTITGISVTDASCGLSNGSATVSVSGGNGSYTYSNTANSQTVATITGMNAGNYSVTVTDGNLCNRTEFFKISNNSTFTASVVGSSSVTCHGGANGSFTLNSSSSAGAGTITYSMVIGGVANTRTATVGSAVSFTNVSAGTYNVFVIEDQSGCSVPLSVSVSQPTAALSVLGVGGDTFTTTCHSVNTSTNTNAHLVSFSVTSSGANTYSYNINGGTIFQVSPVFTGVPAGDYIIGVTGPGCITTATTVIHVVSPPTIALSSSTRIAKCTPSASGGATITATGGNGGYTYVWTPSGQSSSVLSNVAAGTYTVLVKDSKSCEQNGIVTINSHSTGVAVITSSTAVTCKGSSTGKLSADMQANSGGTAPFTYLWSPGGQTIKDAVNLPAGNYTCTITDFNGCPALVTTTLSEATASLTVPAANAGSNPVKCHGGNGGTIFAIADGGVKKQVPPFYDYQWTTTRNGAVVNLGTVATISNTNIIAGTYTCTITDSTKCTFTQTISVSEPLSISLTSSVTPAGCNQADGVVSYTASGGTPNYYYSFEGAAFSSSITSTHSLTVGSYSITVKDDNACEETFKVTVGNPNSPVLSVASQSNISCFGKNDGVISLSVAPTTNTYSYAWSASSTQSTSIGTNLPGGIITVTVTDVASTCKSVGTYTISQPNKLTGTIASSGSVTCHAGNNGFIDVLPSGGTGAYTYTWLPGGGNSPIAQNLTAGNYTLTIKDANGCQEKVTANIAQPVALTLTNNVSNANCLQADGSASVTANGGTPPYNYLWSNGSVVPVMNNMSANTYAIKVTDNNGCSKTQNVSVGSTPSLTISLTTSNTYCGQNNGSALANVTGGTPPYIYQWSSGSMTASTGSLSSGQYALQVYDSKRCNSSAVANIKSIDGPTVNLVSIKHVMCPDNNDGALDVAINGGTAPYRFFWNSGAKSLVQTNLSSAYYDITVTDAANCETIQTFYIEQPEPITIEFATREPICGASDGEINSQVLGGTPPYTYKWNNSTSYPAAATLTNLHPGMYQLDVTDSRKCATANFINLANRDTNLVVTIDNVYEANCGLTPSGAVDISASGGKGAYTYRWSNGSTQKNVTNLKPGLYHVTVTDAGGCVGSNSVTVSSSSDGFVPEICIVTVDSATNTNKIIWEKTIHRGIKSFKVYRETATNNYQPIATIPFSSFSEFLDPHANPAKRSWRYKISAIDSCDIETPLSKPHKTIHLVQFASLTGGNSLIWDYYDGYPYDYFYIMRQDPSTNWTKIDSIPSNLTSYTDLNAPSVASRYMIEIVPPSPCNSSMRLASPALVTKSKSNIKQIQSVTVKVDDIIPTTTLRVYPNPANDALHIELTQLQPSTEEYQITVENALGQLVYQTTTKAVKHSIQTANFKTGVYFVKVQTTKGLMVEKVVVQ